ncbi:DUF397 domain-containing protein [Streptomyces albidoflavus]
MYDTEQPAQLDWFKSSYSGDDGGECLKVAAALAAIHVRDSKERGGSQLGLIRAARAGFVAKVGRSRSN